VDLKQIEVFQAVARHGGFSNAARALGVGQPSLTRSVARLEKAVGFSLFVRGQGAARLTSEGKAFLREIDRAFTGLGRLRVSADEIRNFGTGRLRICCMTALASGLMPRTLRRFLAAFPEATVSLHVRTSPTVYEWVAAERCDIGIASPRAGFPEVEEEPLLELAGQLVVPKGHALARSRRPLTPADIAGEPFLALSLGDGPRHAADHAFEAAGLTPRMRVETHDSATLCAMVAAGLGVAVINPLVVKDYAMLPIVARAFEPQVGFKAGILRPRGEPPSRLAAAFLDLLRGEAETHCRGMGVRAPMDATG
jgi:DNA-binding transcriptional LysR family regulator